MKALMLALLAAVMPASPALSSEGFGCDIKWEGNVLTKTGKCALRGGGAASPSKRVKASKPAVDAPGGEDPGSEVPGDEDDGNNGHGNDPDGDDDSNPGNGGGNGDDDDGNNGHGNDPDGDDSSNPGKGNGKGRNK